MAEGGFDWTDAVAEHKIQEAMEDGLFDNLPGAGKPIDLSTNPFEQPGMGSVNRLLRNNKVLPPWLIFEQRIEAARQRVSAHLDRWDATADVRRGTSDYPRLRDEARTVYERGMRETNDLILKFNQSSPFVHRSPIPFMIARRMAEFDTRYGDVVSSD